MMTSAALDLLVTLLKREPGELPGCVHPALSDYAARLHLELLHQLHGAAETLNQILTSVAYQPLNDDLFDELNLVLGRQLQSTGDAMLQFRERRDCEGNA